MSTQETSNLHFNVSSGLKDVLGSDLITDDEVAIFELVKNAFDADASEVEIYFDNEQIVISDNGHGMTLKDIKEKWLFVAYSFKKEQETDLKEKTGKNYAGSKGIGRFSSDRLGKHLVLETRSREEDNGTLHRLMIDWGKFDRSLRDRFEDIKVEYESSKQEFNLPMRMAFHKYGTALIISGLRREWNRESIRKLRASLAKIIDPFGSEENGFQIKIIAPEEMSQDATAQKNESEPGEALSRNAVINGYIKNTIFSTLEEKTTYINVRISEDGKYIESCLVDRNELIYRIREPNIYPLLAESNFRCKLFFLNRSAKSTFAHRMDIPSVRFGSIFLFRNGFRVFPVGEPGDDWFRIDHRKQQGFKRFLGTRELIGRLDVSGSDKYFKEASSRNAGLITTPAVNQLIECFKQHCLTRLEKYIVPVTFPDRQDSETSDLSRILTDQGKERVSTAISKLINNKNIELIEYNKNIISIVSERSEQFENVIKNLKNVALRTKDTTLDQQIDKAEAKFKELKKSEELARKQADQEKKAKTEALKKAASAEAKQKQVSQELKEEKKRSLFLASVSSLDTETILNLHHQVMIYSIDIEQQIENFIVKYSDLEPISHEEVLNILERISLLNKKISNISRFATKANFRLDSEKIEANLGDYIEQYINSVARDFLFDSIKVSVKADDGHFKIKFKPIDISIIIDNLISNSRKSKSTEIVFTISYPDQKTIQISTEDDGKGLSKLISDPNRIFEKGYSTTDGSGLGLFHTKRILEEINGSIKVDQEHTFPGTHLIIRINK